MNINLPPVHGALGLILALVIGASAFLSAVGYLYRRIVRPVLRAIETLVEVKVTVADLKEMHATSAYTHTHYQGAQRYDQAPVSNPNLGPNRDRRRLDRPVRGA